MKNLPIRILFTVLGAVAFIWFLLPKVIYRIINIGNLTGMAVGVLLIVVGIFFNRISGFFKRITKQKAGKVLMGALSVGVFAPILTALVLSCFMVSANLKKPSDEPVLVVLGCHVIGRSPSLVLRERLEAANAYLTEHPETVCILSGGQGSDEAISEAKCMHDWLVSRGISEDRLIMEDKSTSTRENLLFSSRIMKESGLGNNIALVTNEFHMYRAMEVAKKLDITAGAVPADTLVLLLPTYIVREWYGILYEWLGLGSAARVGI